MNSSSLQFSENQASSLICKLFDIDNLSKTVIGPKATYSEITKATQIVWVISDNEAHSETIFAIQKIENQIPVFSSLTFVKGFSCPIATHFNRFELQIVESILRLFE